MKNLVIFIYSKAYSSQATSGNWEPASSLSSPSHPIRTVSLCWFSSTCSCDYWVYLLDKCMIKSLLPSPARPSHELSWMTVENDSLSLPGLCSHFLRHCQVKIIASDCVSLWQTSPTGPFLSGNSLRSTSLIKKTINTWLKLQIGYGLNVGITEFHQVTNQKTQALWMDTKTRPIYMLSTRDPFQT